MRPTPLLFATLALLGHAAAAEPPALRLNQIQVIGTHNSYHIAPAGALMQAFAAQNAELAASVDYTHRPLPEQFARLGIRQIELDLFADPAGGLYSAPVVRRLLSAAPPVADPEAMARPGMKVLHVQDIDYQTTVPTLVDALTQVRGWLQANPSSCPILVLLELKDEPITGLTQPIPFGQAELDAVDEEILSVFARDEIVLPDDVRGDFATLRQAVLERGWPRLDEVRGKVLFALDNGGRLPAAYLEGHASLAGRVMFVSVGSDHPAAAFLKLNDPERDFDKIQRAVQQGLLVRTRADAGTQQSRENDPTRRDQALASGAQFVSTDYPEPDERFSNYQCRLPGGVVARPNPVTAAGVAGEEGQPLELDRATPR